MFWSLLEINLSLSPESMAFKQKKRVKRSRNKYLKPGALARIRYTRTNSNSCTGIGKKKVVLDSEKAKIMLLDGDNVGSLSNSAVTSPIRISSQPMLDVTKQQKQPVTPKYSEIIDYDSQSRLESLPVDLLVKILCHLHHDQLKAVFHVSQRIRTAVLLARQLHFNYITPERARQEVLRTKTPLPIDHWPLLSKGGIKGIWGHSPCTPKAPRHGYRPSRYRLIDMKQIAVVLFQESTVPQMHLTPPGLPKPIFKPVASTRVLFYEDELCKAVAQNKLL